MNEEQRVPMTAQEISNHFTGKFSQNIIKSEVREWKEGIKSTPVNSVWLTIELSALHDAIEELISIDYPHFGVISAVDEGDIIFLLYHMYVFYGLSGKEVEVTIEVGLPKPNLIVPTISDLIPGAVYSEREKIEMMGVDVKDIPDRRGLFLPEDFPKGVYPWRKDETGIKDSMIKNLWAVDRPEDRPNPVVKPKPEKKKKYPAKESEKKDVADNTAVKDEIKETPEETTGGEN